MITFPPVRTNQTDIHIILYSFDLGGVETAWFRSIKEGGGGGIAECGFAHTERNPDVKLKSPASGLHTRGIQAALRFPELLLLCSHGWILIPWLECGYARNCPVQ